MVCVCVTKLCVKKLCVRTRRREAEAEGTDLKTRTPHNFVGKKRPLLVKIQPAFDAHGLLIVFQEWRTRSKDELWQVRLDGGIQHPIAQPEREQKRLVPILSQHHPILLTAGPGAWRTLAGQSSIRDCTNKTKHGWQKDGERRGFQQRFA